MSSQEQFASSVEHGPARPTGARKPMCPHCDKRMAVKMVAPVLFAGDLDDVTYACENCGAGVKRTVRRA